MSIVFPLHLSSCTRDVEQTENFLTKFKSNIDSTKRTLFTVECHSCVNITPFSAIPTEDEVLLMPGTVMEVIGASTLTTVVHLRESKEEPLLDFPHPLLAATVNAPAAAVAPQKPVSTQASASVPSSGSSKVFPHAALANSSSASQ